MMNISLQNFYNSLIRSNLKSQVSIKNILSSNQIRRASSANLPTGKLANRVAIVTGSTEGIGYAVAKRMAADGAKVVISSRRQEKVTKALNELKSLYPEQVEGIVCHVGSEDDRNRLVDFTLEKFGAIDYLVSNAAVNPCGESFLQTDDAQWDKVFNVNLKAPFKLTQKVVPHMLKNNRPGDKGAIVYVSTAGAYDVVNIVGAYSVSKTALLSLSKTMSREVAEKGIRVNVVAPGMFNTKFSNKVKLIMHDAVLSGTHLKRFAEADEMGGIVSFLCSSDASYITGESIVVAGGYHCRL